MTQNAILQAVQRQLLTLVTVRERFSDTINGNFQHKVLSNWTLVVVVSKTNLRINDRIAPIGGASKTLLTTATKEVVMEKAIGGAWVNQTPVQVICTGSDGSTPVDTGMAVGSKSDTSPVIIVSNTIYSDCGISRSL